LKPRPFVVCEDYIGPDRRRKAEMNYAGPLRRATDPAEVVDEIERTATRDTISVELEALRVLVAARGGVDRETLKMTYRVMQHTSFRARQVRDAAVARASALLMEYVDAMGGHDHCEREVLQVHFDGISRLMAIEPGAARESDALVDHLEAVVRQKIARRRAA
jgi:hypothetical protein